MAFVRICAADDVRPGAMLRIETASDPVLVCNVDGEFYAVDDTCTHSNFSLSEGELDGAVLICPLHDARFCARSGAVLGPPAPEPLRVYPVRVDGGQVYVDVAAGSIREARST